MSYDDIMCRIEENCHDLWKDGYDNGWMACASENANAAIKTYCTDVGDAWRFECSFCGAKATQTMEVDHELVKFKHCPNCGSEVTACVV